MKVIAFGQLALVAIVGLTACGRQDAITNESSRSAVDNHEYEDVELYSDGLVIPFACNKATTAQIAKVNEGNKLKDELLHRCSHETGNSNWCAQLVRPNPASINIFRCTYGNSQVHQLINPDQNTWQHAITAVNLIQELEQKGLRVKLIYNWWRPEPYNANVGGAVGRHPKGTSVDVRFASNADADRAFDELCKLKRQGRIRAIGHYATSAIHFGVGDIEAGTWGKSCPN